MSRRGNPYDNARAERLMRTLKEEEVDGTDYQDLQDARSRIGEFLEQVYNRQRLHSALRYLTPEEFEQASEAKESDGTDGSGGKPIQDHRSHRPRKSLQDFHTPTAQRRLIDKIRTKNAEASPINGLPACLNTGVHTTLSPFIASQAFSPSGNIERSLDHTMASF
jgi:Integrase core domain